MESFHTDHTPLPRNMIENSMFEEEPDVVDLAKEPPLYPLEPDDAVYEPRSSRLLVRGLGENELDEEEEDCESSARLLGMSFMNRTSSLRNNSSYIRQESNGSCSFPSARTLFVGAFVLLVVATVAMVIYFLPKCNFTKEGCNKTEHSVEPLYPISTNGKIFPWTNIRLPRNVIPVQYDISLHPNLTTMTFNGSVSIKMKILEETRNIILHSSGLSLNVKSSKVEETHRKISEMLEYKPWNQIALVFPEDLQKGQTCIVEIEFSANLSDTYSGFYKSSYKNKNGEIRWLAATQFEPLAARTAFPCFDEPDFKATFLIKIKRDANYISLSNMPKMHFNELHDGIVEDEFENSVKMSTYLVAFIVADFKYVSKELNGTKVSVYAIPDKIDQVEYALKASVKLLEFYNGYFQIKYPLQKLDLVAIPDFQAGAMENWGLITFREAALLYDNTSTVLDKQRVTVVIAHELAHQWFGNLVTMEWWSDLWLNEGFATFMEFMSVQSTFPELEVNDDFLMARFKAMAKDSLNSSHPISSSVSTPEEIEEIFDSVSYEKGASILLMLKSCMSEDDFQNGIIKYLKKYENGNTKNEDLWESMSKVTDKTSSISRMMKTWTVQKGFPLVTVTRNGKNVSFQQEYFQLSVDPKNSTISNSLWQIPLTSINSTCSNYSTCKNVYMLRYKTETVTVPSEVEWVKYNINKDGFYLVDYGNSGWSELINLLNKNHSLLSYQDRACLISDIFALSRLGRVSIQQALELTNYLTVETNAPPVLEAIFHFNRIYRLVEKRGLWMLAGRMKLKILSLFGNLTDKQTWNNDGSLADHRLRSSLLKIACTYQHQTCLEKARHLFSTWKTSRNNMSLPADVKSTVFFVGAMSEEGWDILLQEYSESMSDAEKHKILEALASTPNTTKLVWMMQDTLNGGIFRPLDLPTILSAASKTLSGYLYAWDFVKENWDLIIEKFHLGSFTVQDIVTQTTCEFSTKAHLLEVETFFASQKDKGSQLRSVQEAIETIKLNIQWMDTNLKALSGWL
ncbi:leucyl-cystinyl aminopeptidase [Erpetoichthys calabaricus]|uniref:Leucyl/cystinyl aminopeptidase n=1 Tax=Erpetoichthys calabaricus TaxID=27687 RepID=A0A8C4S6L3_ERPCA|nr:leucyl-cystinyl aminopeptidase [Erpetoichthys calabaricus]